jgi:hypothetical protein
MVETKFLSKMTYYLKTGQVFKWHSKTGLKVLFIGASGSIKMSGFQIPFVLKKFVNRVISHYQINRLLITKSKARLDTFS